MYNVRLLLDRAGAIVERYAYDSYGRPRIRESCGRGDMNDDTKMSSTDTSRFSDAKNATIWDPRADMDDDGDVDSNDQTLYDAKYSDWSGSVPSVDPRLAFSVVLNPFMFQGVPHFALDTASSATEGRLMLNHHRARFVDPVIGRWITRDPIQYRTRLSLVRLLEGVFEFLDSNPTRFRDPSGLCTGGRPTSIVSGHVNEHNDVAGEGHIHVDYDWTAITQSVQSYDQKHKVDNCRSCSPVTKTLQFTVESGIEVTWNESGSGGIEGALEGRWPGIKWSVRANAAGQIGLSTTTRTITITQETLEVPVPARSCKCIKKTTCVQNRTFSASGTSTIAAFRNGTWVQDELESWSDTVTERTILGSTDEIADGRCTVLSNGQSDCLCPS